MGWQRDENWFDDDAGWSREPIAGEAVSLEANAPRFAGLGDEHLAAPIPDGLAQSRRRRAELRRRRQTRRTRAAAAVIGPAMLFTLATPRLGASRAGTGPLEEDPPSMPSQRGLAGSELPTQEQAKPTESPPPQIRWRNATSHGLPYSGWLEDGTRLPVEGPDWVTWSPVDDSSPNEPDRLYGNERLIRTIVSALAAYRAANPGAPRVVVGDISFRGGGPMDQHRSHQNGLDVDVYYPREDGTLRAPGTSAQVDRKLAQDLLDRFVAAGAAIVFVGYSTGLHGPGGVVVPYPNHENHMHVRLARHG